MAPLPASPEPETQPEIPTPVEAEPEGCWPPVAPAAAMEEPGEPYGNAIIDGGESQAVNAAGGDESQPVINGGEAPMMVAQEGPSHVDVRTLRHRENSRAWHEKWISKGVPRPEAAQDQAPANMRDACLKFVSAWVAASDMPRSNARRVAAYEAWMRSEERAALLAGRAGAQI